MDKQEKANEKKEFNDILGDVANFGKKMASKTKQAVDEAVAKEKEEKNIM